jgi:hypothetical protein
MGLALCVGCGLPSLPLDPDPAPTPEPRLPDTPPTPPSERACAPNERYCAGSSRPGVFIACDADGASFGESACPGDQICRTGTGECFSISELCGPDDVFKLSTREVFFEPDVTGEGKSSLATVSLTNCTSDVITVRSVKITSPRHEDGRAVFTEAPGSSPLQGLNIAPGDTIDQILEMIPRRPEWPEVGELQVTADSPTRGFGFGQARLSTSTWCLTSTDIVDLGTFEVGEPVTFDVPMHNCGARQLHVSGFTATPTAGGRDESITLEPQVGPSGEPAEAFSLPLGARAHDTVTFTLERDEPGRVDAWLTPTLSPLQLEQLGGADRVPQIRVQGHARAPGPCDASVSPPSATDTGKIGDLATFALFNLIVTFKLPEFFARGWFGRWSAPGGTLHQSTDRGAFFLPTRVGSYPVSLDLFSPESRPACERGEYKLDVGPIAPLYAELTWSAPGSEDPIPHDRGPGRGVDLDLHMRSTELGCWADPAADCWGRADAASNLHCASGATVRALSQSGGSAEVLTHDGLTPVSLGVYLKNRAQFSGARATMRVWWIGQPLHPEGGWTRELTSHDEFWYVGDFADGRFVTVDGSSPNGFPSCQ